MSEEQTSFLLVIPCLNEERYIGGLVEKLLSDNQGLSFQLIIADGGSSDKTPDIARELEAQHERVQYLHNPKRLQSAAVNLAVETYGGRATFMIRIDAHADYPLEFCRSLIDEAATMTADSVVVPMHTVGKEGFQKAVAAAQNSKLGNGGSAHRNAARQGKWVDHGHHALMKIEAFSAVGGYDESFSHNEDAELDIRLSRAGYKIWLSGKTDMIYYPRSAALPLFQQYFKFGQGRVRNILKHRARPHFRQMLPVAVAPAAILAMLSPLHGIFATPFMAWVWICLLYGCVLAYSQKDWLIILSGPAAMIMHFAWSVGFWSGLLRRGEGKA